MKNRDVFPAEGAQEISKFQYNVLSGAIAFFMLLVDWMTDIVRGKQNNCKGNIG